MRKTASSDAVCVRTSSLTGPSHDIPRSSRHYSHRESTFNGANPGDPYVGNWSVVRSLNGFALDRKIHAAGWNFFFMAGEVKAMFFGLVGEKNIRKALKRILAKMSDQNFNCLEVTRITGKHFAGVP
jgi:hypothetical protein